MQERIFKPCVSCYNCHLEKLEKLKRVMALTRSSLHAKETRPIHPEFILMAVFFFIFLFWNLNISLTGYGDDSTLFLKPLMNKYDGAIFSFLADRYQGWSSRLIIEFFTLIAVQHYWLWRIVNTFAMTVIAVFPALLLKRTADRGKYMLLSGAMFLLIPSEIYRETGWIATTTNYLWVLATALLALYPLARVLHQEKCSLAMYFLSLPAMLYACSHEQMVMILAAVFWGTIIFLMKKKQRFTVLLPHAVLNLASLLFILTAPGNSARYGDEVERWFPDYDKLSFFRKIELGFSSTLRKVFMDNEMLIMVALIAILLLVLYRGKNRLKLAVPLFPIAVYLIFGTYYSITSSKLAGVKKISESFTQYGTTFQFTQPKTWPAEVLLIFLVLAVIFSVCMICGTFKKSLVPLSLLAVGFGSRMMMGFSPTIWASGARTFLFCFSMIAFVVLYLVSNAEKEVQGKAGMRVWYSGTLALGAVCLLSALAGS